MTSAADHPPQRPDHDRLVCPQMRHRPSTGRRTGRIVDRMADDDLKTLVLEFRASVAADLTTAHRRIDELGDEMRQRFATTELAMMNALRDHSKETDRRLGHIDAELATLREDSADLRRRVGSLEQTTAELRDGLTGVRRGQSDLRGQMAELRGEFGGLRGEMGELRGDFGGLRGQMAELRGDFGGLRGEMGELREDVGELKTGMAEVLRRLDR